MKRTVVTLWAIALIILAVAFAVRSLPGSITARGQASIDYAAAAAIRSDTLMSWALVAVLALVSIALLGVVIGACVAVVWLLRERMRRHDDGHITRKPTVTN